MPDVILPTLVSYHDWMRDTALLFHIRSPALKALDAELFKYERGPSLTGLARVQEKFGAWQAGKGSGDEWKASSRDKNKSVTLLDQQLRGEGDTDVALGAQAFMEADLINSRLGVLYLFSNLRCEDSIFRVAVEGAIDVSSSVVDFAGMEDLTPAEGGGAGIMENAGDWLKDKAQDKAKEGSGLLAQQIESQLRARRGPKTLASQQLLNTAVIPPKNSKLRILWEKICAVLHACSEKILAAIREKLSKARQKISEMRSDPSAAALQYLPGILRQLCDFLAANFLKSAMPFISAGLDIVKGIANTIDAGITKFKEWLAGRNVELLFGHPSTIVEAIRKAMWFSVGSGLYETLKGGLSLGLEFATAGVSALGSMIVDVVEALVKTIWKIVEIHRMNGFFGEAREFWQLRNESNAIHNRPIAFNNWFRSYAVDLPAISVLTLNSGICGDKMRFLKMYKGDDTIVSQSAFDAGCQYVDSLKVWGSKYLDDVGFSFGSEDKVIQGLLKMAQSHARELSAVEKGLYAAKGFLNA